MKTYGIRTYGIDDLKSGRLIYDGNLDLADEQITELPEGLDILGWLDISRTKIKKFPQNIKIGGSLLIDETPIENFADCDQLIVGGDFDLLKSEIQVLPNNFTVIGNFRMACSCVKELPNNLTIGGWLDISYTSISHIPESLAVGLWVIMDETNIDPEEAKNIHYLALDEATSTEEAIHKWKKARDLQ